MKSKLQDGNKVTLNDGWEGFVEGCKIKSETRIGFFYVDDFNKDLKHYSEEYDIIRVTRNNEIIWQRDEPMDINKMATVIHNGVICPVASHENMKILVDRISELEKEISNLKQGK